MNNIWILAGLFFFLGFNLEGQSVQLKGTWGYRTSGNQICIYGDDISNERQGGKSGTLKLALYATDKPFKGGTIYGYCLFEAKMSQQLSGGYHFQNVEKNGKLIRPPKGAYCMTLLLLEYNDGFTIIDWISFDKTGVW